MRNLASGICSLFAASLAALPAQQEIITEDAVREAVTWLADDARRGRDTGSPELNEVADWLAAHFASAELKQAEGGSWFHEYSLPGLRLDSREIDLKLTRGDGDKREEFELEADRGVRLWRPCDMLTGDGETCTVVRHDMAGLDRLLANNSARRPVVLVVPESHPDWIVAAGERIVFGGRRAASRPVFLVLDTSLPAGEGDPAWTAKWSLPAPPKTDLRQRNVVGVLPGTSKKDEYVVVSAHYDHIGVGAPIDGDAIYNGADDDATGTTAVVLLAAELAKGPPLARSVMFVCFSAEERGLLGSAAFCERPPVPIESIVANLNLEMLGRPEPGKEGKAWVTGSGLSDFADIVGQAMQRCSVELVEFPMSDQLFWASDNWSFVKRGVVAHSVSAGSLHRDYHQPSDEVNKLDIAHMTRVIRALAEAARELANRDASPAWNEKGRKMLERRTR